MFTTIDFWADQDDKKWARHSAIQKGFVLS